MSIARTLVNNQLRRVSVGRALAGVGHCVAILIWVAVVESAVADDCPVQDGDFKAVADLAETKLFAEALTLLEGQAACCKASTGGDRSCGVDLQLAFGDVYRQYALHTKAKTDRERYLEEASRSYGSALTRVPGHPTALVGLTIAQKRLGRESGVEPMIRRLQSERSPEVLLTIGDMFQAAGEIALAKTFYWQAAGANPEFAEARSRLIRLQASAGGVYDLIGFLPQFEVRFPYLARQGYAWGMERVKSEELLIHWVTVMGENGWLTLESLEQLPAKWQTKAVVDLRQAVAEPTRLRNDNWWIYKDKPRAAFGRFVLKRTRMLVEDGHSQQALALLEAAISYYPVGSVDGERIELQSELALLYIREGNPEKGISQMQSLIDTVKSMTLNPAFEGRRHEGERRVLLIGLHSTLGVALASSGLAQYSERAKRHLNEAVSVAAEEQRVGVYYPIADAKEALYSIYKREGKTAQALSTALDSAKSYLDLDHLDRGTKMIGELDQLTASEDDTKWRRAVAQLRHIAETRSGQFGVGEGDPWSVPYWTEATPEVDRGFLERQGFKLLADLASVAQGQGQDDRAHRAASRAFEIVTHRINTLQGARDLLRIEILISVLLNRFPVEGAGLVAYWGAYGSGRGGSGYYAWHLCLSNDTRLARVDLSYSAGIAAVVSSELGSNREAYGIRFLRLGRDSTLEVLTIDQSSKGRLNEALLKADPYKTPRPLFLTHGDIY